MKLIASSLISVGIFIAAIGIKVSNYQLYIILTGFILVGIGVFILIPLLNKEISKAENDYNKWKHNLFINGIKREIDLNHCKIKYNNFKEEITEDDDSYKIRSNYEHLDHFITGKDLREFKEVKQSVIIAETDFNGTKTKFYSPIIDKDPISLQFLLADKKKTFIYIDRYNSSNYYFDLDFIFD